MTPQFHKEAKAYAHEHFHQQCEVLFKKNWTPGIISGATSHMGKMWIDIWVGTNHKICVPYTKRDERIRLLDKRIIKRRACMAQWGAESFHQGNRENLYRWREELSENIGKRIKLKKPSLYKNNELEETYNTGTIIGLRIYNDTLKYRIKVDIPTEGRAEATKFRYLSVDNPNISIL